MSVLRHARWRAPWLSYLLLGAAASFGYRVFGSHGLQTAVAVGVTLGALGALIVGIRRYRPSRRLAWYLLVIGQVAALGSWIFWQLAILADGMPPAAGTATDFLWIANAVALLAGLVLLLRSREQGPAPLLDSGIFTCGLALVAWIFLLAPALEAGTGHAGPPQVVYCFLNVAMLAVLARLTLRRTLRSPAGALLLASVVGVLASDVLYTWLTTSGRYTPGAWADLGWLLFHVLVGSAALHPSMATLYDNSVQKRDGRLSAPYLVLLAAASLSVPGLIAFDLGGGEGVHSPVVLALATALALLVFGRLAGLIRQGESLRRDLAAQNRHLHERRGEIELLRELAEATDASSSTEEALERAIVAICAAVGLPVGHVYVRDRGFPQLAPTRIWHLDDAERFAPLVQLTENLHFVAGHGVPGRVLELAEPVWVSTAEDDPTVPRAVLAQELGIRTIFAFPVLVHGEVAAVLEFFSPEELEPNARLAELSTAAGRQLARVLERGRAEAALRASEERFRGLVANVPGAIYRIALGEKGSRSVHYVSDDIAGIVGHTAEDLVEGRIGAHDVIHPDDMEMLERGMADAIEAERQFSLEYRMIHADGSFRWVSENGRVLRDEATGERWLDGAVIDVTERKRAEDELRRLALIVESSGDAIFGLTLDGHVTSWNSAAEAATGYSAEEMTGRHIARVLPEDRHGDLALLRDRLLGGEAISGFETKLLKRSGETTDVALSVALISGEAGLAVTVRDITAAKEAERKLRDSETRTRMLFDTALDAVVSMDERGRITSWNTQAETIFGWTREEAIGRRLADTIVPAAYREAHERGLARYLETGEAKVLGSRIEITALARDGREFPVELAIVPIEHEGRYEFSAFLRDISARKDSEERLREAEERYRILVEQLPMITYIDLPGDAAADQWLPHYVSPQLETILGWSHDEWMSDPDFYFSRIVHPDDQTLVTEAHDVAFEQLSGHTIEHRLLHRDGSTRWVVDHMLIARDDEGRPMWAQGYLLDITERKEAEERLREAETRYAAIVESSDDAIFGLSMEGIVTSWNAGAERLYGYSAAEIVGQHAAVVIPPEFREREAKAIAELLRSGQNVRQLETERIRKDGSRVPVSVSISPMRAADGTWLGAAGIARDITEQKAAKAELERLLERERAQVTELRTLDTMKDEFIALVSHELRTPLTSIRGYLELVTDGGTGELSPEQEQFLGVVARNAERLQSLVGDLLFVAQIEAGRLQLETGPVELEQIAAEAAESGRPLADQKQIELTLEAAPVPTLEGDRGRLGQLLDNFLSNAIKFTPEGGSVHVRVREHEGSALIEVADTGMGIPEAEQERLFERFFRTSSATAQAIQGTGLGLTISKAIAEAHGGRITFTSTEGKGTTFRIELPLAASIAEAA